MKRIPPVFRLVRLGLACLAGTFAVRAAPPGAPDLAKIQVDGKPALVLGFDQLAAFPYVVEAAPPGATKPVSPRDQIPAWLHACNGQRVTITGFLIPITIDNFRTRQFVIVRSPATCCYGIAPNINEFVLVTMKNEGVTPTMDVPVTIVGTLKVGEAYENGYLVGIYQVDGEKLIAPEATDPLPPLPKS